jgi:integrase
MKGKTTLWDTEVRGFGARRQTDEGDIIFVWKGQAPLTKKQVFLTIGRWGRGDWRLDDARRRATEYREAVRLGRDPAAARDELKNMMTVAELCDVYLEAAPTMLLRAGRAKKASTLATDTTRIEAHIKPLLGHLRVPAVTHADIETFMHRVAAGETARPRQGHGGVRTGGKGAATRTVGLLGAIFTFAIKRQLRADNPIRGVVKFAEKRRERRMTADEYKALAEGLAGVSGANAIGVVAIRFLALTGWRRGEAVNFRWTDIDAVRRVAVLPDTKSGRSVRPLSRAALDLLATLPRMAGNPHVFPAGAGEGGTSAIPRTWGRVREFAKLPADISPHVLRHSFASEAADAGLSEMTIAVLIGHKRAGTTARYMHGADATLLAAADTAARHIQTLWGGDQPSGEVVQLRTA